MVFCFVGYWGFFVGGYYGVGLCWLVVVGCVVVVGFR